MLPTVAPVGLPGYFSNGDPRRGMLATQLDQDMFNAFQEEIAHVIEEADIALNKARFDQLLMAILVHIKRNVPDMPFLPLLGGTMQGPIYQHIAPTNPAELPNMNYVDGRDNAVIAHADAQDAYYHNAAVTYANSRAIQEADRAQNNAWAWDQTIWDRLNWIDTTQGGFAAYSNDAWFIVPGAARVIDIVCVGGGGGGGGCHMTNYAAGGGGAGGLARGSFPVAPGQQFWVSVGGGAGGAGGGGDGSAGGNGNAAQFGDWLGAGGGIGGYGSAYPTPAGGAGGTGYGTGLLLGGGSGGDGTTGSSGGLGGNGAASFWGGGGRAGHPNGANGYASGSGGGGAYRQAGGVGGAGSPGLVTVSWHR